MVVGIFSLNLCDDSMTRLILASCCYGNGRLDMFFVFLLSLWCDSCLSMMLNSRHLFERFMSIYKMMMWILTCYGIKDLK